MEEKPRILVVEDEQIVARDIESSLRTLGYSVAGFADSAETAVGQAVNLHPDLVLMDIMLKGERDGVDAANQIRRHLNLPVIYLTAYTDANTLDRAKPTQPFGYL